MITGPSGNKAPWTKVYKEVDYNEDGKPLKVENEDVLNKSYESLDSKDEEKAHYNIESDNEPPQDEVDDVITIIKKR